MPSARILIVEDDELTALVERASLEAVGFEIEDVRTGEEALARLAEATYDAMVLDQMLPGLRGEDVLRELSSERLLAMPVLVVSGYDDARMISKLRDQGAADYLVKDGEMRFLEELPRRMTSLVEGRGDEE